MIPLLTSLDAPVIVVTTTSGATGDDNIGNMTTLTFQSTFDRHGHALLTPMCLFLITSTLRESLANRLKMRDHDTACPICFEEFRPEASIVVGVIKSCGHYFHLQCLVQWLDAQSSCPVCRGDAPLDLDAIKAISYTDLRTVVGIRSLKRRTPDIGDETLLRKLKESRAKSYAMSSHTNPAYEDNEQGQGAMTPATNPSSVNTPTGTLERNRQRCSICHERYEDNPQFMVVGYMPRCGHYFHFRCIWNYVMSHNHCPTCGEQGPDGPDVVNSAQPEPEVDEAAPTEQGSDPGPSSGENETESEEAPARMRGDLEIVMALLSDVSWTSKSHRWIIFRICGHSWGFLSWYPVM